MLGNLVQAQEIPLHPGHGSYSYYDYEREICSRNPGQKNGVTKYGDSGIEGSERRPANFTHDDSLELVPVGQTIWLENILVEDNDGVLSSIRHRVQLWQDQENYVRNWDLETTGMYNLPSEREKQSFIGTNLLRYFDRRLSGEIKNSEQGSTMNSVGKTYQAMKPKAEAQITQNVKLKFRARMLQGQGTLNVENPWVEARGLVTVGGRVEFTMAKNLKPLGVTARVNYYANRSEYEAIMDKQIYGNFSARYSSIQDKNTGVADKKSNQILQLMFNQSF